MSRENNMKEYKSAYNIDTKPTFGAGSVFGQEAKEEARRKKFGYIRKNYNPEAQPWVMQIGAEKNAKKYVLFIRLFHLNNFLFVNVKCLWHKFRVYLTTVVLFIQLPT